MEKRKLTLQLDFDDLTQQFETEIPEIEAYGSGKTIEDALGVVIDNAIMMMEDYYENKEEYGKFDNYKNMEPVYEILSILIKHIKGAKF